MRIICLFAFVIMLILSYLRSRSVFAPSCLFNLVWTILISISIIGVKGIDSPIEDVYFVFFIGGLLFNIGVLLEEAISLHGCISRSRSSFFMNIGQWSTRGIVKLFWVVEFLLLGYYLLKGIALLQQLGGGMAYNAIRSYYYSDEFLSSQFEYFLISYVFDPFILITEIIFAVNLVKQELPPALSSIMFINILLRAVISGGRMVLFEFAIIVICCFLILRNDDRKSIKTPIISIFVISILAIGAVMISTGRGQEGTFLEKIWEMLVVNFTGSFTYFGKMLTSNSFSDPTYGGTTFAGLIDPFINLFKVIGFMTIPTRQILVGNITSKFLVIGTYSYNAMPTMYYYFMNDLQYVGIILFSLLFGMFIGKTFRFLKRECNIRRFLIFVVLVLTVVESPMSWLMFKSSYVLAMAYIYFIFKNQTSNFN